MQMNTGIVFLKRTNSATKRVIISQHQVWHRDLFLRTRQDEERKLRDDGREYDTIMLATENEYRTMNWPEKKP
jgi:hypothetical protein